MILNRKALIYSTLNWMMNEHVTSDLRCIGNRTTGQRNGLLTTAAKSSGYGFILTFTLWTSFQHHVYIWIKLGHFEASGRPRACLFSRTLFEFVADIVGAFVPVLHLPCSVPLGHHGAIGAQWGHCFSCTSVHVPLGPPSAVLLIWFLDLSAPTKWVNTFWGGQKGENRRF